MANSYVASGTNAEDMFDFHQGSNAYVASYVFMYMYMVLKVHIIFLRP